MRLLLAIDAGFEPLAAVALCSFLIHNQLDRVVVVTPAGTQLQTLPDIASRHRTPFAQLTIPETAASEQLEADIKPYFYCIEAIEHVCHGALAGDPGRYLYVDADTLCVRQLTELARLRLSAEQPLAACSHGRPMIDRQLLLQLASPYHYFNAGVLLFDSAVLAGTLCSQSLVDYHEANRAICRFREQCALNGVLRDKVRYLPNQYNYLSWMRSRATGHQWHQLANNSMAYCLEHVRESMAIVHLSAGAVPTRVAPEKHEAVDRYWLELKAWLTTQDKQRTGQPPTFEQYCEQRKVAD